MNEVEVRITRAPALVCLLSRILRPLQIVTIKGAQGFPSTTTHSAIIGNRKFPMGQNVRICPLGLLIYLFKINSMVISRICEVARNCRSEICVG